MSAIVDDDTRRALEHAPRGIEEIRAAMRELAAQGLGDHEIARILGLNVQYMRTLLDSRASA